MCECTAVEQMENEKNSVDAELEDANCPICFDVLDADNGRITACGHVGCITCFESVLAKEVAPVGDAGEGGGDEESVSLFRALSFPH